MRHSALLAAVLAVVLPAMGFSAEEKPAAQEKPAAKAAAKPAAKPDEKPVAAPAKPVPVQQNQSNQAKPDPAEALFAQGRDALFQRRFDAACELLAKAVAADPSKTSYRLNLARALRFAGKTNEAVKQFEELLKAAPDHVEAGQALAELYSSEKQWKAVVDLLDPLLKYRHDYPTYHMLAEAYQNLDDKEKARKAYEEALKLNPQSAPDHYQLGNIYLASNFFALAAESYHNALRLGLDSPLLRFKLGSALFNLRNYFGAVAVTTVKSGNAGTINGPWYLIEEVPGDKDEFRCAPENSAIYQIEKAVADGLEERPDVKILKATIFLHGRRYAKAYEMFEKIRPSVPKEEAALVCYYFAQAAFGCGKYDRYLALLEEAIKLDSAAYKATRVDAYLAVADQYNQSGDLKKYIEFLNKAVAESPHAVGLHLKLGSAYAEAQRFDLAVSEWRMVLDLEPENSQRMTLLNLIQKHAGGK